MCTNKCIFCILTWAAKSVNATTPDPFSGVWRQASIPDATPCGDGGATCWLWAMGNGARIPAMFCVAIIPGGAGPWGDLWGWGVPSGDLSGAVMGLRSGWGVRGDGRDPIAAAGGGRKGGPPPGEWPAEEGDAMAGDSAGEMWPGLPPGGVATMGEPPVWRVNGERWDGSTRGLQQERRRGQ